MQPACSPTVSSVPPPIDLSVFDNQFQIASGYVSTAEPTPEEYEAAFAAKLAASEATETWPDTLPGRIAALISPERGAKLVRCRHGGFAFKYLDGNRGWRPSFACHLTILCQECAMDQAIEQFDKYKMLSEFIPADHFTRITVPIADPAATDALMDFLDRTLPRLPLVAKIKPASDTVEALYVNELTTSELAAIRKAYPAVRLRRWHSSHFYHELHRVLDADGYPTPESCALADAKYSNCRLLRVHGISQEDRKKLSLMTPIRDNFPEPTSESSPGGGYGSGFSQDCESDPSESTFTTSPASNPPVIAPKSYYHRTASGRLFPVPSCPCGCGAAPISFAAAASKDDNSPDLKWITINLETL